jgi:hypothetical protein
MSQPEIAQGPPAAKPGDGGRLLARTKEGAAMPTSTTSHRGDHGGGLQRVTVNLTPRSCQALEQAIKLTRDSQTDTLNRAIQVYAYIMNITENNGTLYVRDDGSDELERLRIL